MKRVLSCILCIAMLMQCVAIVTTADTESVSGNKELAGMAYVLNKLGVVEISADTDFEKEVSRAEFASFLNNILKYPSAKEDLFFIDVPSTYWAAESINALVPGGIISYAANGRFNPDDTITYEQMCKMLVYALGYGKFAETTAVSTNDFSYAKFGMGAYVRLAKKLEFDISVKNSDAMTLGDVISVLYRAMQTPLPDVIIGETETLSINRDGRHTWFSVYYNAYTEKGTINAYFGASLSGFVAEADEVLINDTVAKLDAGFDPNGLLGQYCDIVYTQIGDVITLIYASSTQDEILEVESQEIIGFDAKSKTLKYYNGDHETSFSFTKAANIVFNGRVYTGDVSGKLNEFINGSRIGKIRYTEPATQYSKEVLEITSYEVYIAGKYDKNNEVFYEYYDNSNRIKTKDFETVIIKNSNGVDVSIPETFPAPMLVGTSDDNQYLNLIVCSRLEDITVTTVYDGKCEIKISDGRVLKVLESVYPELKFVTGGSYSVAYDIFGNIIFATEKSLSQDMKIGYLRFIEKADKAFENEYYMGIYAEDKAFHNYRLAEKILIDEYPYKSKEVKKWLLAIPGNTSVIGDDISVERQIIRYTLDAEERIKKIDTYICTDKEESESTLSRIAEPSQSLCWDNTRSSFGMNVYVTGDHTKQIIVPQVDNNGRVVINGEGLPESADMYGDSFAFKDWTYYSIEAYKYDPDMLQAEIIVCYAEPIKEKIDFIMFEEVSQSLDEDGDVVTVINGVSNGAEISMPVSQGCADVLQTLNKGDIVHVDTNFLGDTAYRVTKAFDVATKTFEPYANFTNRNRFWYATDETVDINDPGRWRNTTRQMTKSYAYDQKNVAISSSYTLGDAKRGITQQVTRSQGVGAGIYDSKAAKDSVYTGTASDINTYKTTGESCDMILICSYGSVIKQIFVYR